MGIINYNTSIVDLGHVSAVLCGLDETVRPARYYVRCYLVNSNKYIDLESDSKEEQEFLFKSIKELMPCTNISYTH